MKGGFNVVNLIFKAGNAIIVNNYPNTNEVFNACDDYKKLKELKDKYSIGIWKIKKLK